MTTAAPAAPPSGTPAPAPAANGAPAAAPPPVAPPAPAPAPPAPAPVVPPADGTTAPPTPAPAPPPAAAPVVPENYELTLPANGVLDATDLAAVTAMAKEGGWTNEQAQTALNELQTSLAAQTQTFITELEAHPEIGGVNRGPAQENMLRALDRFLPASEPLGARLRTELTKTGKQHDPAVVLLLSRIGKAMREDRPNLGLNAAPPAPARKSDAEVMYPNDVPRA